MPNSDPLRLEPNDITSLIKTYVDNENSKNQRIITLTAETKGKCSFKQEITFYLINKNIDGKEKQIVFTHVCKDSKTKTNEPALPSHEEVFACFVNLAELNKINIDRIHSLIMPTRQCRGYLSISIDVPGVQKEHIVLTEFNFSAKKVIVHDSQADLNQWLDFISYMKKYFDDAFLNIINFSTRSVSEWFYTDHLDELIQQHSILEDFKIDRKNYNNQEDRNTCGIYVHQYFLSYLKENGSSKNFNQIKVRFNEKEDKEKFPFTVCLRSEEGKRQYIQCYIHNYIPGVPYGCYDLDASSFEHVEIEKEGDDEFVEITPDSSASKEVAPKNTAILVRKISSFTLFFNELLSSPSSCRKNQNIISVDAIPKTTKLKA